MANLLQAREEEPNLLISDQYGQVHVKYSTFNKQWAWKFNLDFDKDLDSLALVCFDKSMVQPTRCYVIPRNILGNRTVLSISRGSKNKWLEFLIYSLDGVARHSKSGYRFDSRSIEKLPIWCKEQCGWPHVYSLKSEYGNSDVQWFKDAKLYDPEWIPPRYIQLQGRSAKESLSGFNNKPTTWQTKIDPEDGSIHHVRVERFCQMKRSDGKKCGGKLVFDKNYDLYCSVCKIYDD